MKISLKEVDAISLVVFEEYLVGVWKHAYW